MVTVEVDPVRVESRLAAGGIGCPTCRDGVLGGWGYARARRIEGLSGSAAAAAGTVPGVLGHPRVVAGDGVVAQSVCGGTDLGRVDRPCRGGWASPDRREPGGSGGDGAGLAAPRRRRGWRRFGPGFSRVAVAAGVDVRIPDGTGCAWRDVLAAVATATAAIRFRFGAAGLLRRGDAGAGGGRGQWWSAAGTGMVATTQLRLRNTNRP